MFDKVTCIYFDLDNTLIDRNAALMACLATFFEEHLPQVYFYNEQPEIEENDDWGYVDRNDFVAWLLQKYQPWGWEEESLWNYIKTNISSYVSPISLPLQQKLKHLQHHYQLGILTNGSISNQSRKIKQAQLEGIFSSQQIHISQQHQLAKPNPLLFQRILEQEQLQPEQLLYVGDDPINDIVAPAELGIATCWVSHNREWNQSITADHVIEQVLDLPL
ncbi:MAG: HAD family hydrolase [Aureispira sp.]